MSEFEGELQSFTESKGGLKFDVVLSESPNKKSKRIISPTKKDLSLSEIENKLEAAEKRRLSQQFKEQNLLSRRLSHVIEVRMKKHSSIKIFKSRALEKYIGKMLATGRNREAYLKSIQKKNRDLLRRVTEIKNTTLFLRESHFDSFCKKLESDEQTRKAQFQIFEEMFEKLNLNMEELSAEVRSFKDVLSSCADPLKMCDERMDHLVNQVANLTEAVQKLSFH